MTHWGIYNKESKEWLRFTNGQVVCTTSRAVADIQFKNAVHAPSEWEVKAFPEDESGMNNQLWYGFKHITSGQWIVDTHGKRVVFETTADAEHAARDYFVRGYDIAPCPIPPSSVTLGGGGMGL